MLEDCYDRQGRPITLEEMHDLKYRTPEYKRVGLTNVGDVEVSTVWLGFNYQLHPEGPVLIFETMIFGGDEGGDCWRYTTEAQAIAGHDQIVAAVRAGASVRGAE